GSVFGEQGIPIVKLHFRDGVPVGGDIGSQVNGCGRRIAGAVSRSGQRNGRQRHVGDRHVSRSGGNRAPGIINGLRRQAVAPGAHARPGKSVGGGSVFGEQGRPIVKLHFCDGVPIGGDIGSPVNGCGRRIAGAVSRGGQRDGRQRHVGNRHVGRGGGNRAPGIINGLGGQAVAAGAHAGPGKSVGGGSVFGEQGRPIVKLHFRDGVPIGGDIGSQVNGCGRRIAGAVSRCGQRDGRQRHVGDRHVGRGGGNRAPGIINGLRRQAVAPGAHAGPGKSVGG